MNEPVDPLVSVLLPVRNADATLEASLRSVARQSERRFECVVVDDGSTDRSGVIARRSAAADPRFAVVAGPGRGLVAALAAGLARCRAPYVARMDADDLMHRDRLRRQVRALETSSLDAVGCHVRSFPRRALGPGMREYETWINTIRGEDDVRREAFVECPIAHPTLMARRDVLCEFGYRDRGWPEDYDLLLRWLESGRRVGMVPKRLLAWRHTPGRLSRTDPGYATSRFVECKAAFLASGFLSRDPRYILWGYGATGRLLSAALRERWGKRPVAVVEVHPGRVGNRVHGAEFVAPERLLSLPRLPLIASVAGAGPRGRIRAWLQRHGWRELTDFVCAA